MKPSAIKSAVVLTGCVFFGGGGLWIAFGRAAGHTDVFDRAGGVALAILFFWVATRYFAPHRHGAAE
jgi:hypothetical protein